RRGRSVLSLAALEYWVARSSRAMTAERDARPHSHGAISPELCKPFFPPLVRRRQGNPAPTSPLVPLQRKHRGRTTGTAETTRLSPRNGFTVSFVLSPVSGLYCHRCRARTGGPDRRQGRGARTTRLRRTLRAFPSGAEAPDAAASIATRANVA